MSVGNLKNQGNKGNNFPFQLRALQALTSNNLSFLEEQVITAATANALGSDIDAYFAANPNYFLVAKSIVYDGTQWVAFLTISTLS